MAEMRNEAGIGDATVPDGAPLLPSPSGEAATLAPAGGPLPTEPRPSVPGYEIHEELGRGGMGVVYKARQLSLNRFVALKMILAGPYAGTEQLARFRLEAEAVARLQHPGIVHIHEIGSQAGHAYLALEYVAGGTLTRKCAGRPLPPDEAATLVEALARAVHYAHQQGIVHRDLKPGNVLLTEDGRSKITDFGLAKRLDPASAASPASPASPGRKPGEDLTTTGAILGTPAYMAPEQAGGKRGTVGPSADVYALGAILYDLLTGRPPFQSDNAVDVIYRVMTEEPMPPRRIEPTCPRDLETVCLKCLRKDPAGRYASAADLADDLGRFLAGEPTQARPPTAGERFRRWSWRRRWWLAGCGSVACLLLLLVVSLVFNAASLFFAGTVRTEGGGPPTVSGTEVVAVPAADGGRGGVATAEAGKPAPVSPVPSNPVYYHVLNSVAWIARLDGVRWVTGTGTLIDRENRLVLTTYENVTALQDWVVSFPIYDGENKLINDRNVYLQLAKRADAIKGKVLAHDKTHDLALIMLDRVPDGIDAMAISKETPGIGDFLNSFGNPGHSNRLWVYTPGLVDKVYQKTSNASYGPDLMVKLNAKVIEARMQRKVESGGPCCNNRGELVGVSHGSVADDLGGSSVFIACTEAEDFINRAFAAVDELRGKKWVRSQRPPLR